MQPIWKDYFIDLPPVSEDGAALYRVWDMVADVQLFQGRAFPRPGATSCRVRLNDILAPYLSGLRQFPSAGASDRCSVDVIVQLYRGGSWEPVVEDLTFFADWSYQDAAAGINLQDPINTKFIPGQRLFSTSVDADMNAYAEISGVDEPVMLDPEYANQTQFITAPVCNAIVIDERRKFTPLTCGRYILYYINAQGGWDAFVVQGRTVEIDAVTRQLSERVYDNSDTTARGEVDHLNTLTRQFTFYTHPMPEDESLRMHHLLNSTMVYVHDLEDGTIRPLTLTGSTTEYKAGPRLYTYAITARLAQGRERR